MDIKIRPFNRHGPCPVCGNRENNHGRYISELRINRKCAYCGYEWDERPLFSVVPVPEPDPPLAADIPEPEGVTHRRRGRPPKKQENAG